MYRVLLAVLFVFCWVGVAFSAAQIHVPVSEVDLGVLYSGQKSKHTFVLENHGDQPLVINKVRTSCGCTSAFTRDKVIEPGASTELAVQFNSKNFRGNVLKRIMLFTNDPSGKTELRLRARVLVELALKPARIKLGLVEKGQALQIPLTLTNLSDLPVADVVVRCTSRLMTVEGLPQRLESGETVPLNLTVNVPDQPSMRVNGYLLFSGRGHVFNQLRIPVTGTTGS
ncbi:DUF1573 domain-containing protein [Desulfuromonas acetoxidans]|uniref:DUF1573 domain-containing protein n=1 Tax=Desulfuromonas acetoxidans TaxID=891 RepID=UPI00292E5F70|nr:DUF1573 domain-containing protein [Desulfuromonas acetoxidans]